MMGKLDIKIQGVDEIFNSLMNVASSIPGEMAALLETSANEAQDMMRSNVSSKTGSLSRSISYQIEGTGMEMRATIGPNDGEFGGRPVGRSTELGRVPGGGFPNWYEIANRYGVSIGVGFLIAKKIHEQGSNGIYYGRKTMDTMEGLFMQRGIETLYAIASRY